MPRRMRLPSRPERQLDCNKARTARLQIGIGKPLLPVSLWFELLMTSFS